MASAYVMSIRTGRKLIIDWQAEETHFQAAGSISSLFKIDDLTLIDKLPLPSNCDLKCLRDPQMDVAGVVSKYWNVNLDQENAYLVLPKIADDPAPIVYLESSVNFMPDDLEWRDFLLLYKYFYSDILRPSDEIAQAVDKFTSENFKSHVVGVHYRGWVTVGEGPDAKKLAANIDHYIEEMNKELKKNPSTKFYLATDNAKTIQEFKGKIDSDKIVTYSVRSLDRLSLDAQIDAVIEWYILARTDFIIGTFQSSFSEEAAYQTKEGRKINIGPQMYPFHSVLCFNALGKPFPRPMSLDSKVDPCLQYSIH